MLPMAAIQMYRVSVTKTGSLAALWEDGSRVSLIEGVWRWLAGRVAEVEVEVEVESDKGLHWAGCGNQKSF